VVNKMVRRILGKRSRGVDSPFRSHLCSSRTRGWILRALRMLKSNLNYRYRAPIKTSRIQIELFKSILHLTSSKNPNGAAASATRQRMHQILLYRAASNSTRCRLWQLQQPPPRLKPRPAAAAAGTENPLRPNIIMR